MCHVRPQLCHVKSSTLQTRELKIVLCFKNLCENDTSTQSVPSERDGKRAVGGETLIYCRTGNEMLHVTPNNSVGNTTLSSRALRGSEKCFHTTFIRI